MVVNVVVFYVINVYIKVYLKIVKLEGYWWIVIMLVFGGGGGWRYIEFVCIVGVVYEFESFKNIK